MKNLASKKLTSDLVNWTKQTRWGGVQIPQGGLIAIRSSEPRSAAVVVAVKLIGELHTGRLSSRNGRLPRTISAANREASDPSYRMRMSAARQLLASEFLCEEPMSLANLRLQRGYSQQKLAEKIGTSQSHIAKIEAGIVNIYWDTATRLADALGVTLEALRPLIKVVCAHPKVVMEGS